MMKPLKFRCSLLIALGLWAVVALAFWVGPVRRPDFTFGCTFVFPAVLLVVSAPLSVKRFTTSRLFKPGLLVWAGMMLPIVWIVGRSLAGFGPYCDWVALSAGMVALAIGAGWTVWMVATLILRRKLNRLIQAAGI